MNGKEMIDFKRKWIGWTLEFVQTDLKTLTKSRVRGLCCETAYFISSQFGLGLRFEIFLSWVPFDELPQIKITNFDEAMLTEYRKRQTTEISPEEIEQLFPAMSPEEMEQLISKMQLELSEIQAALSSFLEKTQSVLKDFEAPATVRQLLEQLASRIEASLSGFPGENQKPGSGFLAEDQKTGEGYPADSVALPETKSKSLLRIGGYRYPGGRYWDLRVEPNGLSRTEWAILNFANLMNGLPIYAIRRCKGCSRYFLNLSLREKVYCNPVCASRSIAQTKRDELKKDTKKYEAYLKKQGEYSMKRYKKMRQDQFGLNVRIGKKMKRRKPRKED